VLSDSAALAVVAVGLSGFALLVAVALAVQLGRLRRAYDRLVAGDQEASFVTAMNRSAEAARQVRADVQQLRTDLTGVRTDLSDALRHVAVVRYDAFADLGGRLSFSAALLDDAGDGLVITSINSRTETRTYAKSVLGGGSEHELSPEEEQAIAHATRVAV
jgi:hypothetical protein